MHRTLPGLTLLAGSLLVSAFVPAFADDASCAPVFDALLKMARTPNHQYMHMTNAVSAGGKTTDAEYINTSDTAYLKMNGQWRKSPLSPQDHLKQEQENIRDAKVKTCKFLRNETVDGQSAAVYSVHEVSSADTTSDGQVWVGKSDGLPLRTEIKLDVGDGPSSISTVQTRSVYTGVAAPAGVK